MDTILKKTEFNILSKACEYLSAISIFAILVFSNFAYQNPLLANDLIANTAVPTQTLIQMTRDTEYQTNPQILKNEFNSRMATKYNSETMTNVADGVKHIKLLKYYNGKPVKINAVILNQKVATDYEVKPAIASSGLQSKRTLRNIAQATNSIVAINGGFFKPQTGVPLGTLMINHKLYTGPIYDRVAFGIFENGYGVSRVQLNAKIYGNGHVLKIDNINQPRMLSSYILAYTSDWGYYAPKSPQYGVQLQIVGNRIIQASANPLPIPKNGYVIVGPKSQLGKLFGAKQVNIDIQTNPKWENVKHIISGGPYLVKDNQIFIDITAQKLQSIGGRNPRTAIGHTKEGDLVLVAVDGREGCSIGLTLFELANLMKYFGCVNAINLDGGGSTVMYINGQIVNHPNQPGGIALSNAIVVSKKL